MNTSLEKDESDWQELLEEYEMASNPSELELISNLQGQIYCLKNLLRIEKNKSKEIENVHA